MATQKWTNSDLNHLIEHGLTCYERLAADTPYLNHSFTLHYESLVNLPERSIAEISHWAGLEDFVFEKLIRSDLNDHYFNTWLSTPLIEREETIEKFEHRANRFGYSLKEKSPLTNSIKLPEF